MPSTARTSTASINPAVSSQFDSLRLMAVRDDLLSQRLVIDGLLDLWNATDRPPVRGAVEHTIERFAGRNLVASAELMTELDVIWTALHVEHVFDDYVLE